MYSKNYIILTTDEIAILLVLKILGKGYGGSRTVKLTDSLNKNWFTALYHLLKNSKYQQWTKEKQILTSMGLHWVGGHWKSANKSI